MTRGRPEARRRGGPAAMTVGYLGVGGTMALLLVVGSYVLSSRHDGGLIFTVYVANFFGLGIATPTELLITRRYNVGRASAARAPRRALAAVALVTAVAVWVAVGSSGTYQHIPEVGPAAALAVVAWAALVSARSRLAGAGDLHAYAVVLIVESAARMVLLVAAVAAQGSGPVLLYAAAGVPLLCSALAAAAVRTSFTDSATDDTESSGTEQLSFIIVLLGYQGCLNLAPLLLSARTGSAAFGNANAYFRTPLVMLGGLYTHGLVDLSHAWGAGDVVRFRQALRNALRRTVLLLGALTAATTIAAPLALRILYHPEPHLPLPVYAALAASGVLAGVAVVTGLALQATGHAGQAALAWLAAALVTVGSFTASSGSDALAAAGLLAGPLIALVAISFAVRRLLRSLPSG